MKTKEPVNTNLSLTPEAKGLLRKMATDRGISMTATVELAIRFYAKYDGFLVMPRNKGESPEAIHE